MKRAQIVLAKRVVVLVIALLMIIGLVLGSLIGQARPVQVHAFTSARAMATIEMTSGRLLYAKNENAPLPMASTTKIVTAITVLEHVADIEQKIRVHDKSIGIEGTSVYLQKGEELTVRELLYGLMLRSGNDCSVALALHVSKSVEDFAGLMNAIAIKAGAKNSNFKNPHGLDEEGHYTTALDLALITAYAMKNSTFAEIVRTKDVKISGPEYMRPIANKNRLLRTNPDIVGVKTGFTSKAGRCFVGAHHDMGMTTICVVLNCGPMFPESESLMERATEEFRMHKVLEKDTMVENVLVREDFLYPLKENEISTVKITTSEGMILVHFNGKLIYKQEATKESVKIDNDILFTNVNDTVVGKIPVGEAISARYLPITPVELGEVNVGVGCAINFG